MIAQPKPTAAGHPLLTAAQLSNQWALFQRHVTGETDLNQFHAQFDRWLAEHDAQVAAGARADVVTRLGELAANYEHDDRPDDHPTACIYEVLADAADRIAAGTP